MEDWSDDRLLTETPRVPAAFAVFYRRHEGPVLGYFMRRTGDAELAADLAAETFAAALLAVRRFRPDRGDAVSWLYGIARHRLLRSLEHGRVEDRARRRLAMPRLEVDDDLAERIERLGAEERALELLGKLPPDQAEAVRARVLDQRSYSEIAAAVRTSEAVVRKRVSRGLMTLRGLV
jgi:RNA polymerase sigma factor (sigma-70 family)